MFWIHYKIVLHCVVHYLRDNTIHSKMGRSNTESYMGMTICNISFNIDDGFNLLSLLRKLFMQF